MTVIQDPSPWHQRIREHGVGRLAYLGLLVLTWGLTFGVSFVAGYSLLGQPSGTDVVPETTRFIGCGFACLICGATWLRYINIGSHAAFSSPSSGLAKPLLADRPSRPAVSGFLMYFSQRR
jgi:hypothetical protein